MNGTLGGDMGLQNYHQASTLLVHQGFSQQDASHYHASPGLSLNSLQSMAPSSVPTASLGQFVISSTPQTQAHNDMGYGAKLNADVPDHTLLSVQSSPSTHPPLTTSHPSLPPLTSSHPPLPPLASSHPPLTSSPASTSPTVSEGTVSTSSTALLTQMNQLGPSERCTVSQAQSMGQQLLNIIAQSKRTKATLPSELQNSFDVFHRCLAVVYGTFFLNLYTKANAPCLLCHGCKSLYPPGQFIHHTCSTLPPNILPCRSRMWRRCLVPLVSPGMDKLQQKQRWKYVLEKFSHTAAAQAGRRNHIPPEIEAQLLEMPELKRGRFVESPSKQKQQPSENGASGASGGGGASGVGEEKVGSGGSGGGGYVVKSEESLEERLSVERSDDLAGGHRFQGLVTMAIEEDRQKEEEGSSSPEVTQKLLDIEPPDFEMEEGASPSEVQRVVARASAEETDGNTTTAAAPTSTHGTSAMGLAERLVGEVRKLQQELFVYRAKLSTATEIIEKMPSEACMREQLAQALATQQTLMVERDQAREQLKLAQERGTKLQRQLDGLRDAYGNMEKLFAM